jgi:alkanesulfonate monooxygenase
MEFYYFGGYFDEGFISRLEESGFSGVMFTYDSTQGDMFTQIARDIKHTEKIKYLVAIRPYTISPQYICMINNSINKIMPGRLQINLISGYIKDHEANFGGIIGDTNDSSSNIDKSKYIINYLESSLNYLIN